MLLFKKRISEINTNTSNVNRRLQLIKDKSVKTKQMPDTIELPCADRL